MDLYTTTLTIFVPKDLKGIASKIARAIDPDVGGDKSFDILSTDEYVVSHSPCIERLAEQAPLLMSTPEMLQKLVADDYAVRWPDLTPPTVDECKAFCEQSKYFIGTSYEDALSKLS